MKRCKVLTALVLACLMLLTACGKKAAEETVTTQEIPTAQVSALEITEADRAYLKTYLADYEAGKFDGEKLFEYQRFTEFVEPFNYKGLTYPADPSVEVQVTEEDVDSYLTKFLLATLVSDDQYVEVD